MRRVAGTGRARGRVLLSVLVVAVAGFVATSPARAGTPGQWDVQHIDALLAASSGDTVAVGDMFLHRATLVAARDAVTNPSTAQPYGAGGAGTSPWPSGVIPYEFDSTVSAAHQGQFVDAASEWSAFANVTFVPRTSQTDYVTVHDDPSISGGNSFVGVKGGQQFVNIGSSSWNRSTLLHELGHTLGFQHEQQRSDRDTFVTIQSANIIPGDEANFVKLSTTNYTPYDFLSVMHYSRNAESIDPATKDTIVPQPAYAAYLDQMGQQVDRPLSTDDRAALAAIYGPRTPAPGPIVTNTRDSGPGSLRAAIEYAFDTSDATPGSTTTVAFHIPKTDPGFDGTTFTIHPTASLPALGNRTIIDGGTETTFAGDTNPNGPEIVIRGDKIVPGENYASGFVFRGSSSVVKKVVIEGFDQYGVEFTGPGSTANQLTGSYVGTDPAGITAMPNTFAGVQVDSGAQGNTVGGASAAARNIISGNGAEGVRLDGVGTTKNIVDGNTIGLGRTSAALPNTYSGVGIFDGASANTIGGTKAAAANTISGNTNQGVAIAGVGSNSNIISGNRIGTDPSGTSARPNAFAGVQVWGGARSNVIGGTTVGAGNVISGNASQGVALSDGGTTANKVQGNLIGTNPAGTAAVGNAYSGIDVFGGAASNTVGGTVAGAGNVISGNQGAGMTISGTGTKSNVVAGNRIGTTAAGTTALPNAFSGVEVFGGATANTVGGTAAGAGNVISGNGNYGVTLSDATTASNLVQGNTIGRFVGGAAGPNTYDGVGLWGGAHKNSIGGTAAGAGNDISFNGGAGVIVFDAATTGNAIRANSMTGNNGLGINLVGGTETGPGVTANDATDADHGPNELQNYPVLTSAVNGSITTISGTLTSIKSKAFTVELFASPSADPSLFGEGTTLVATATVTTNLSGAASFSVATTGLVPAGEAITATATDSAGNTSEFAQRVLVS